MRRITIMHIIVSLIAVAILSVQFCQAAQMGQYDFSGDLTAHFAPSPPPMGEGATFVQSSGAMLFHNASTNARLEIVMHKNYQPGTDHDWAVSVDASIPLAYDTSPPPENGDAWIELGLAVQYLDAQDNQHTFLDALGVYYDKSGGGPLGRQLSPAELLNGEKVPHPDDESFLTNETAVLTIAYSASSMTLSATSAGTKLLTISLQDWQLTSTGRFDIALYGHSDNQPILPTSPMRLDNFAYWTVQDPVLCESEPVAGGFRFQAVNLIPGNHYTTQTASNLSSAVWLDSGTFSAVGPEQVVTNASPELGTLHFFRLRCD